MQRIRPLHRVARILKLDYVSSHLHFQNRHNLATCTFAFWDRRKTDFRKPILQQNQYGSIFINNSSFTNITFNRFASSKPDSSSSSNEETKIVHPHRHKKPSKVSHSKGAYPESKVSKVNGNGAKHSGVSAKQTGEKSLQDVSSVQSPASDIEAEHERTVSADADQVPDEQNLSIFQRFKRAYKEHGKILIGVHVVTSSVWFGCFFYAAKMGVDIVPLLESWGFSETIIKPFKSSNVGNVALAYLMYKLATPARYTVTLGGTNLVIRYFRKTGRMAPVQEGDTLRELYKDSKDNLREKRHKLTSDLRERRLKTIRDGRKRQHKHK